MNLLDMAKTLLNDGTAFVQSKNSYFENHNCTAKGESVRVQMNMRLKHDLNEAVVNFGICPFCKTVYYHEDIESKTF